MFQQDTKFTRSNMTQKQAQFGLPSLTARQLYPEYNTADMPKQLKQRRELAREIIDEHSVGDLIEGKNLQVLKSLCGINFAGAFLAENQSKPDDRHLHIQFCVDDEWECFSWRNAIQLQWCREFKPDKLKDTEAGLRRRAVHAAAREAIYHQVSNWKRALVSDLSGEACCAVCGSTQNLQVDHVKPPFIDILDTFIDDRGAPPLHRMMKRLPAT